MGLRAEKEPQGFLWITRETLRTLDCVRQALDRRRLPKFYSSTGSSCFFITRFQPGMWSIARTKNSSRLVSVPRTNIL